MSIGIAPIEKPRKQPVQARSVVTVEAILDAVLQVLIAEGKDRLTTTRVAARAGVSVGTLYQYFPNKSSLLQATLRRKLTLVAEAVEQACIEHRGEPLCAMLESVTAAFFQAKLRDAAGGLALYAIASDVDGMRIAEEIRERSRVALAAAVESSPERLAVPTGQAVFVLQAAMLGVSRHMLETRVPIREHAGIQQGLVLMLRGYLESVKVGGGAGR